jgi:hypothetical protein
MTSENIRRNLLEKIGDYDTFFYIAENKNSFKIEKYFNKSEITDLLIEKEEPINESGLVFHGGWPPHGSTQVYLQMLYSMRRCNDMRLIHEKNNNFKYDRIIRSRIDVKYFNSIEEVLSCDMDHLYIPDFHCWSQVQGGGYNDRFAISNRDNMNVYLTQFDSLREYISEGHHLQAESTLHYHLKKNNISVKYCPIRFTRVRENGHHEDHYIDAPPSSWPSGEGK